MGSYSELAISEGPIEGSGVDVASSTMPAMIVGYVLPYLGRRLSVETILAAPLTMEIKATGTMANESLAPYALGTIPTGVEPLGEKMGTVKSLPPVVTLVYRHAPEESIIPYVGAGVTYMLMYDAEITNETIKRVSSPVMEVDDALGLVLQAGIEANVVGRYYAFFDAKAMLGMSMTSTIKDLYVETPSMPLLESTRVGDATVETRMTPITFMAGAGANF